MDKSSNREKALLKTGASSDSEGSLFKNSEISGDTKGVQTTGTDKEIPLTISQPLNNQVTDKSFAVVKGITKPGADVSINDQDVRADAEGKFEATVSLDEGENNISVLVNDDNGAYNEVELTVNYVSSQ